MTSLPSVTGSPTVGPASSSPSRKMPRGRPTSRPLTVSRSVISLRDRLTGTSGGTDRTWDTQVMQSPTPRSAALSTWIVTAVSLGGMEVVMS